tara:strand:- start:2264 stop:3607 length:1344 start_codon:yes stop_codon:yes gene_type:complete
MCGIFGLYNKKEENNTSELIEGLKRLQHRGRDGFGVVRYSKKGGYQEYRMKGEVIDCDEKEKKISSKMLLGHLRYRTSGDTSIQGVLNGLQPLKNEIRKSVIYLCHNGNVPMVEGHDTLYILNYMRNISYKDMEAKVIELMNTIPGSYSIVFIYRRTMYAMRDRYGIRPLCIGENDKSYYVSSESCAMNRENYKRDVRPGEIIKISNKGLESIYQYPNAKEGLCAFELIYFLNNESFVDGYYVRNVRKWLGHKLAENEQGYMGSAYVWDKDYIVIGIPASGIDAALGYSDKMGYKYKQYIVKREEAGRTFILMNNESRVKACKKKFAYDKEKLKGKKVIIVDDTIVRGNVMKSIVDNLKDCEVKEIHVRIPAPPVKDICELGIAIKKKEELIMNEKKVYEVRDELGVDSLLYLDLKDMKEIFPKDCYDQCFSGEMYDEIKAWKPIVF